MLLSLLLLLLPSFGIRFFFQEEVVAAVVIWDIGSSIRETTTESSGSVNVVGSEYSNGVKSVNKTSSFRCLCCDRMRIMYTRRVCWTERWNRSGDCLLLVAFIIGTAFIHDRGLCAYLLLVFDYDAQLAPLIVESVEVGTVNASIASQTCRNVSAESLEFRFICHYLGRYRSAW